MPIIRREQNRTRVTIRDIAKHCNLSIGAVSSVLQNRYKERRFAESTVQKIRNGIRELGYIPDLSARRLRKLSFSEFPLVLAVLSTYEAPPTTIMSYLYELRNLVDSSPKITEKYDVSIVLEMYSAGKLREKKSLLSGDNFNAAIIANTTAEDDEYLRTVCLPYPNVIAGRNIESYYCVTDDSGHGKKVLEIFKESGRKKMGILLGNPTTQLTHARRDDFVQAVIDSEGVSPAEIVAAGLGEMDGYAAMKKFLSGGGNIDALFCSIDALAVGAYRAIKEHSLVISKDISIVGIGDYSHPDFLDPPLTTVGTSKVENAQTVCKMLLNQIIPDGKSAYVAKVPLRTNLRNSH